MDEEKKIKRTQRRRARYHSDPDYRQRVLDSVNAYRKRNAEAIRNKMKDRYRDDPVFRAKTLDKLRRLYKDADPATKLARQAKRRKKNDN